ncbi:MAG: PorT family protein [Bacteroidetes bacterium]|nr:PorT family protein [Bacteroidota bacterium]
MSLRLFPALALLFTCPLLLQAQRPSRSGVGFMGGPQVATWQCAGAKFRPVPGFVLGFYAPIWVGNRVEIQPDLLLSLQGMAKDLPDGGRTTVNSLSAVMPVSLKFFINRSINIQAGVQGGYLLFARSNEEQDVSNELNTLDMGANIGAGIGTSYGLDITLRYYNGLMNTLRDDNTLFPANRTLQLTVGHRFSQFSNHRRRR